jgi:RNA polymerase sigma factor (sigma-70 family)
MSAMLGGGSGADSGSAGVPRGSDRRVLAELPESCPAQLFDYCSEILRDPASAADAVRDTLIAAETQIGKLRQPARLQAWLFSIARRQCLSRLPHRRRASGTARTGAALAAAAAARTAQHPGPDAEAEARELETILVAAVALDGLGNRDRELLSLAYKHGLSDDDVGVTVGVTAARARRRLARASRRFGDSAAVAVVLRRRWTGCEALERIVGDGQPAFPRLTPRLRRQLTSHISRCDTCTWGSSDDLVLGPDLLAVLPWAAPPAESPLPGTGTAAAGANQPGLGPVPVRLGRLDRRGFPVQPDARRGPVRMAAAASVVLALLVAGGIWLHESTLSVPSGRRTTVAAVAPVTQNPAPTSPTPAATSKSHEHRHAKARHSRALAPFPGQTGVTRSFPPPGPRSPAPSSGPPSPSPSPSRPHPSPTSSPSPPPSPPPFSPSPTPSPSPSPTA